MESLNFRLPDISVYLSGLRATITTIIRHPILVNNIMPVALTIFGTAIILLPLGSRIQSTILKNNFTKKTDAFVHSTWVLLACTIVATVGFIFGPSPIVFISVIALAYDVATLVTKILSRYRSQPPQIENKNENQQPDNNKLSQGPNDPHKRLDPDLQINDKPQNNPEVPPADDSNNSPSSAPAAQTTEPEKPVQQTAPTSNENENPPSHPPTPKPEDQTLAPKPTNSTPTNGPQPEETKTDVLGSTPIQQLIAPFAAGILSVVGTGAEVAGKNLKRIASWIKSPEVPSPNPAPTQNQTLQSKSQEISDSEEDYHSDVDTSLHTAEDPYHSADDEETSPPPVTPDNPINSETLFSPYEFIPTKTHP